MKLFKIMLIGVLAILLVACDKDPQKQDIKSNVTFLSSQNEDNESIIQLAQGNDTLQNKDDIVTVDTEIREVKQTFVRNDFWSRLASLLDSSVNWLSDITGWDLSGIFEKEEYTGELYIDAVNLLNEYISRINSMEGVDPNIEHEGMKANRQNSPENLYTRDDFTQYDEPYQVGMDNSHFYETGFIVFELQTFMDMYFNECADTREHEYCTFTDDSFNETVFEWYITFYIEGDNLYIERINTQIFTPMFGGTYYSVNADVISLKNINDKLELTYVRHYTELINGEVRERMYLDQIVEDGHVINATYSDDTYYYQISRGAFDVQLFTSSGEGVGMNFFDPTNDLFYSVQLDPEFNPYSIYMTYYTENNKADLNYNSNGNKLTWNLLETDLWEQVDLTDPNNAIVFKGGIQVLMGYEVRCSITNNQYCSASKTVDLDTITEQEFKLENQGLLYSRISLTQFLNDYNAMNNNPEFYYNQIGFTNDFETNKNVVASLFTLHANSDLMNELWNEINPN